MQTIDLFVGLLHWPQWNRIDRVAIDNSTIVHYAKPLGFVRVDPQLSLQALRFELKYQLGEARTTNNSPLPKRYAFVRIVTNHAILLSPRQELLLQVKDFLLPKSELLLVELNRRDENSTAVASPQNEMRNKTTAFVADDVEVWPNDAVSQLLLGTTEEQNVEQESKNERILRRKARRAQVSILPKVPRSLSTDIVRRPSVANRPARVAAQIQQPRINSQNQQADNRSSFRAKNANAISDDDRQDDYLRVVWEDIRDDLRQQIQALELKEDTLRTKIAESHRRIDDERQLVRDEWQKRYMQSRRASKALEAQLEDVARQRRNIVSHVTKQVTGLRRIVDNPTVDVEDLREQYYSITAQQ